MNRLLSVLSVILLLSLTGCINIAASLQPEDASVPAIRAASECVPILFGLSYGQATVEGALAQHVRPIASRTTTDPAQPISKVRRVQLHDYQILMFGARCVEVVGE
jgi:hypothetical protein